MKIKGVFVVVIGVIGVWFLFLRPSSEDIECMAQNFVWETDRWSHLADATGQNTFERTLIAQVVFNRIKKRFPGSRSVCSAIYKRGAFSWTYKYPDGKWSADKQRNTIMRAEARRVLSSWWLVWPFSKWRCVTFYKRADDIGVSQNSKKIFEKKTYVGQVNEHAFYCGRP